METRRQKQLREQKAKSGEAAVKVKFDPVDSVERTIVRVKNESAKSPVRVWDPKSEPGGEREFQYSIEIEFELIPFLPEEADREEDILEFGCPGINGGLPILAGRSSESIDLYGTFFIEDYEGTHNAFPAGHKPVIRGMRFLKPDNWSCQCCLTRARMDSPLRPFVLAPDIPPGGRKVEFELDVGLFYLLADYKNDLVRGAELPEPFPAQHPSKYGGRLLGWNLPKKFSWAVNREAAKAAGIDGQPAYKYPAKRT